MKTAISIEDGLLEEADRAARRLGLSRSGLFARAVGDFLARETRDDMLRRLNDVYSGPQTPEKRLLRGMKAKVRRTIEERW